MSMTHVRGKNKGQVVLYALSTCVWCKKTKRLLEQLGVEFDYVYVDLLTGAEKEQILADMARHTSTRAFPTMVINNGTIIQGYQEKRIREVLG
ncbi:MAG: glutaredoxin family protein [Candidatus Methanospirareceae archaeon]